MKKVNENRNDSNQKENKNRKRLIAIAAIIGIIVLIILLMRSCGTDKEYTIELAGDKEVSIVLGNEYRDQGVNFIDSDGEQVTDKELINELTKDLIIDGLEKLNTNEVGTYEVSYTYGGKTVIRRIHVIEGGTIPNGEDEHPETPDKKEDYDLSGVRFTDKTFVFDGKEHHIYVTGNLPAGVTVSYENNGQVEVGEYVVTANFRGDNKHNPIEPMTAKLIITAPENPSNDKPQQPKPDYDMSGVVFSDQTFTYDGAFHSIYVSGTIPAGVTVSYTGNWKKDVGQYVVVAHFRGDNNHNAIPNMSATMTIQKAYYDMSGIEFNDATFEFDGKPHSIYITGQLPAGVNVRYVGNQRIEVGTYTVVANFTGDSNHYPISPMSATLTIKNKGGEDPKPDYDMSGVEFNDKSFVYDGASHSIYITGQLPAGVTVRYENNGQVEVGEYVVIAHFHGDSAHNPIPDMKATMRITQATYNMSGIRFEDKTVTYNDDTHYIYITGRLPEGVSVSYSNNGHKNVGSYKVVASFSGDSHNYKPIPPMEATLTIKSGGSDPDPKIKVSTDDVKLIGYPALVFTEDGNTYNVHLNKVPTGTKVSYVLNNVNAGTNGVNIKTPGTYTITANLELTNPSRYEWASADTKTSFTVTIVINSKPIPPDPKTKVDTSDVELIGYPADGTTEVSGKTYNVHLNKVPTGTKVTYSCTNAKATVGTDGVTVGAAGVYKVVATLTLTDPSKYEWADGTSSNSKTFEVEFGIIADTPADPTKVDVTGVRLTGYPADGTTEISGKTYNVHLNKVPTGTEVSYTCTNLKATVGDNGVTVGAAGVYKVVATLALKDKTQYQWVDGTTADKTYEVEFAILADTPTPPSKTPIDTSTIGFEGQPTDGTTEDPTKTYNVHLNKVPEGTTVSYTCDNKSGTVGKNGVVVGASGKYNITATLTINDTSKYKWADGTTSNTKTFTLPEFAIIAQKTKIITSGIAFEGQPANGTYEASGTTYDIHLNTIPTGTEVVYTCDNNSGTVNDDGVVVGAAGTYNITATLKITDTTKYEWADGTTGETKVFTLPEFTIAAQKTKVDTTGVKLTGFPSTNFPYNGNTYTVVLNKIPTGTKVEYVQDGTNRGTSGGFIGAEGTYNITATLSLTDESKYEWADGAQKVFNVIIKITAPIGKTPISVSGVELTGQPADGTTEKADTTFTIALTKVPAGTSVTYSCTNLAATVNPNTNVIVGAAGAYKVTATLTINDPTTHAWEDGTVGTTKTFEVEFAIVKAKTKINVAGITFSGQPAEGTTEIYGKTYDVALDGIPEGTVLVGYSCTGSGNGTVQSDKVVVGAGGVYNISATLRITDTDSYEWSDGNKDNPRTFSLPEFAIIPLTKTKIDVSGVEWTGVPTSDENETITADGSKYTIRLNNIPIGTTVSYSCTAGPGATAATVTDNYVELVGPGAYIVHATLTINTNLYEWEDGNPNSSRGYDTHAILIVGTTTPTPSKTSVDPDLVRIDSTGIPTEPSESSATFTIEPPEGAEIVQVDYTPISGVTITDGTGTNQYVVSPVKAGNYSFSITIRLTNTDQYEWSDKSSDATKTVTKGFDVGVAIASLGDDVDDEFAMPAKTDKTDQTDEDGKKVEDGEGEEGKKTEGGEGEEGKKPENGEGEEGKKPENGEGEEGKKPENGEGEEGKKPENGEGDDKTNAEGESGDDEDDDPLPQDPVIGPANGGQNVSTDTILTSGEKTDEGVSTDTILIPEGKAVGEEGAKKDGKPAEEPAVVPEPKKEEPEEKSNDDSNKDQNSTKSDPPEEENSETGL